jgi:hypothetical protein
MSEIRKLRINFLDELRKTGVELSENADCRIYERSVSLFLSNENETVDGSYKICIYASVDGYLGFKSCMNSLLIGSNGAISPLDISSYWRILHSASILKNWDSVCEIVNKYCRKHEELLKRDD